MKGAGHKTKPVHPDGSSHPEPKGGTASCWSSATSLGGSSQMLVAGPYDFRVLRASLLRGKVSNVDKYKVFDHQDQPLQYKFSPVTEGKQL